MKNLTLSFFVTFLTLVILEKISQYFFTSIIPNSFVYHLPSTTIKKKLVNKFNMSSDSLITIRSDTVSQNLFFPKYSFFSPADPEDLAFGAIELSHYNDGFCNPKELEKYDNAIASFGDSFTYCLAVEPNDAWPMLLSMGEDNNVGKFNYGAPGTGPWEYYNIIKNKINSNHRIIVVAIYEGNDLRDTYSPADTSKSNEKEVRLFISNFLGNYYLPNLIIGVIKKIKFRKNEKQGYNFKYIKISNEEKILFNINNIDQDEVEFAQKIASKEINSEKIYSFWSEPMGLISSLVNKNKSELIYIYIPSAYTSFGDSVSFFDKDIELLSKNFSKVQSSIFNKICDNNNYHCINLIDDFIKYNYNNRFPSHFPSNLHLTSKGHQLVAKSVNEKIRLMNVKLENY